MASRPLDPFLADAQRTWNTPAAKAEARASVSQFDQGARSSLTGMADIALVALTLSRIGRRVRKARR